MEAEDAWALLASARKVYTARGKSVRSWDPARDDREEILRHAIGRSGNLRAPTLRAGDVILIGFNEDLYRQFFGGEA